MDYVLCTQPNKIFKTRYDAITKIELIASEMKSLVLFKLLYNKKKK